jgi:hypothetical protein
LERTCCCCSSTSKPKIFASPDVGTTSPVSIFRVLEKTRSTGEHTQTKGGRNWGLIWILGECDANVQLRALGWDYLYC